MGKELWEPIAPTDVTKKRKKSGRRRHKRKVKVTGPQRIRFGEGVKLGSLITIVGVLKAAPKLKRVCWGTFNSGNKIYCKCNQDELCASMLVRFFPDEAGRNLLNKTSALYLLVKMGIVKKRVDNSAPKNKPRVYFSLNPDWAARLMKMLWDGVDEVEREVLEKYGVKEEEEAQII
jgi:hypothetical protein